MHSITASLAIPRYGDCLSTANTYGQLEILSEELSELEQAKNYYLQALKIFVEFEDEYYSGFVISKLASLDQKTDDDSIVTEFAAMSEMTEAAVREVFSRFN